jgi:hypothetical protein
MLDSFRFRLDMVSRKALRRSVPPGELPDFAPVPRKCPRHDGWTPERQRAFIAALADTGCVGIAARMVNMSQPSVYQLRRQPGATSFRAAMDAAQTLGLQPVKDEAFDRAMNGQLVPVFVGGKLMGFRRVKNDRLLMFILRHYGQDAAGRRTTINYFSTRASAAASAPRPLAGEGLGRGSGGEAAAAAEASTTTVKTIIAGGNVSGQLDADDDAANVLDAFQGAALDAEAQAEIYRTLEACAERRRALEQEPEDDPERAFVAEGEAGDYLGELEGGLEEDWVEYQPDGEHRWESLGEGGNAAGIDEALAGMAERQAALTPAQRDAEAKAARAAVDAQIAGQRLALPRPGEPELGPDDPRLDWRNWRGGGYHPPSPHRGEGRGEGESEPTRRAAAKAAPKPRKPYKKRKPKPPFTAPDEARKAEAVAEEATARREGAAQAERRRGEKRGE